MKEAKESSKNNPVKEKESAKPDFITFTVEGTKYKTLNCNKNQRRAKWSPPNVKEIKSYIPGTINKVSVKKGETVKTGDLLLVYEAMKMQNMVQAPFNGVISDVFVKEGDRVPKGVIMIKYE